MKKRRKGAFLCQSTCAAVCDITEVFGGRSQLDRWLTIHGLSQRIPKGYKGAS